MFSSHLHGSPLGAQVSPTITNMNAGLILQSVALTKALASIWSWSCWCCMFSDLSDLQSGQETHDWNHFFSLTQLLSLNFISVFPNSTPCP